jgi:membrane associated rhomboid family serine protease
MIPIRDDNPRRYPAIANWSIMAINVMVYSLIAPLPEASLEQFFESFAFVPSGLTNASTAAALSASAITILTSMFLHGGLLHLVANMWTLWIFGDNVEDRMGTARYISFYVLCGVAAGLTHWLAGPDSDVPVVGASGAISGVMGAYLLLFPRARIVLVLPLLFLPYFFTIPAWLYLGIWFLGQQASGVEALGQTAAGGVAFWAHIGGFVAGMVLCRPFLRPRGTYRRPQPDELLLRAAWSRRR